jgi:hypothetical protein
MLGEFREAGRRFAPVLSRSLSSLTGVSSEIASAATPKLSRAFSTPAGDLDTWKQRANKSLQEKSMKDEHLTIRTKALEILSEKGTDKKLVDDYIKELLQQNADNYIVIQELNSLYLEKKATPICTGSGADNGC